LVEKTPGEFISKTIKSICTTEKDIIIITDFSTFSLSRETLTTLIEGLNQYNVEPLIIDKGMIMHQDDLKKIQDTVCPTCHHKGFYKPDSLNTLVCEICGTRMRFPKK
jgi:predicted acyltransferase (DUF342 family)